MEKFLSQIIFKIILVLFILLKIFQIIKNTLEENIFGLLERLKAKKEK